MACTLGKTCAFTGERNFRSAGFHHRKKVRASSARTMVGSTTPPVNACESQRNRIRRLRRAHMWIDSRFRKNTAWCGCVWANPSEVFHRSPKGELPGFRLISTGPYAFHAQGPRIIENILDLAHLPIAHAGLLGDPANAEIGDYTVTTTAEGIVARDIPLWQPDPDGTGRSAKVHYTYWVERPFTTRLTKMHPSQQFAILGTVTPVDAENSLAWVVIAMNYAHDVPEKELRDFQDKVTAQDIRIVNSQRPELLPLDLQSELHLRSDQIAIAYRRWLKQLGLQYGTS